MKELMQEETITITKTEYEELLAAQRWVDCLEGAGVDNWEGYDEAVNLYQEDAE